MRFTWSVECGPDDPVLVVPWSDPEDPEGCHFVDLRKSPYDLDRLVEAEAYPPLLQALRALNAGRSPVFTAKCDVWAMSADELEATREELDLSPEEAAAGFTSYVDLLWRERALYVSFHRQQQQFHRLERLLEPMDQPAALAEAVLRPALVDLTGPQEGFAVTLYVKALGTDAAHAYERWTGALEASVALLRGRDFAA